MSRLVAINCVSLLLLSQYVSASDNNFCSSMGSPFSGNSGGGAGLLLFSTSTSTTTSTCITSNADNKYDDNRQELEHYIQVSYSSLKKEAATECGEYVQALYSLYIDTFAPYNNYENLSSELFCDVIRREYDTVFSEQDYSENFIAKLESYINRSLDE